MTFSAGGILDWVAEGGETTSPFYLTGLLWLSVDEVRLYDEYLNTDHKQRSIALVDPEAIAAVRSVVAGDEYLGRADLQAWVRMGIDGPELYNVYSIAVNVPGKPPLRGGRVLDIRPVPHRYQYERA